MLEKIIVIFARANWCGHCKHFEPIYEKSIENYKNNKYLKDFDIEFENYDMADENRKNSFMLSHFTALDKVEGYPTILINKKTKSKNIYIVTAHTHIDRNDNDEKNDDEAEKNDAADRFLNNISNSLKSLNSDNKILYTMSGGAMINYQTSLTEELYRKKYLKYKSKYIELKNNEKQKNYIEKNI